MSQQANNKLLIFFSIHAVCLCVCPLASAEKVEDQCEFPGCTKPKRKEGTRVHDYCCHDHADHDASNSNGKSANIYLT